MQTHTPNNFSKRKLRTFRLLLVFGGLLVGLVVAEIALRVVGYSYPEFYTPDEPRGYALAPNVAGWYRKEGKSFVEINSDGLRDIEHSITKSENTVRIAILGDSYSEALQVPTEDAFWRVMQRKLQECDAFDGKQIEVINFGVSGYGTALEYITLKERVWKYSPDIVVLAVTTNNDITDNYRRFKKVELPYFVYRGDKLTLDDSFKESSSFKFKNSSLNRIWLWLGNSLRVFQAINEIQISLKHRYDQWKSESRASQAQVQQSPQVSGQNTTPAPTKLAEVGIDNQIYQTPKDEHWKEAWRVTEGLIALMNDDIANNKARLLVITLSNAPQVHPIAAVRGIFLKQMGGEDLFYPDNRIKSFCEIRKIPVVTLAPELQSYAEHNNAYLHGFDNAIGNGHWNSLGHKIAGEVLSEKLCQGLLK